MGQGTEKNIEDVKVGDTVVSQSEEGKRSVSTVTKLDQPIREHMCKIMFGNGDILKVTDEHPLMTKQGWKAIEPVHTARENPDLIVKKMKTDDEVVKADGKYGVVKDISCWSENVPAYNLILDGGAHTYFADGYLAHNKGVCEHIAVNCPAGTERSNTVISSSCPTARQGCNLGTAEVFDLNSCCATFDPPRECGDWYACPTPQNPDKMCRDCTDEDPYCTMLTQNTYSCVPICASTAPAVPVISAPANGAEVHRMVPVDLAWNAISNWGTACTSPVQQYEFCIGWDTANPCNILSNYAIPSPTTKFTLIPSGIGTRGWTVRTNNGAATSAYAPVRSICIEGF